ncbi:putative Zn 2Cys6 transcription factor [Rosellinia necatrix]|uniref:Putative Zn 2Cys6 transcription factor n=1 Tax=Rosellinia necatrix TaxID=77044 RepID=A0A1W2TDN3_ROSNE|nr:putative Zn 2Cys6 transcription factor [Rosellinia necatrix]
MSSSPQDSRATGAQADGVSPPANAQSSQPAQPTHLRSCVLCRQRKVKCDRRQPCSNCTRAGASCVHPPGAGRAAKRPRQAVDVKVLDRLSQLETTIKRLQQQAKGRDVDFRAAPDSARVEDRETGDLFDDGGQGTEAAPELGRLVIEESRSRYVSNVMWAGLTESIEQLRGMFLDTDSKDGDSSQIDDSPSIYDAESPNMESLGPNAAILGYRSLACSLRGFHPSVELSMRLFQLFNDNVLPVVRIFHTPTLIRLFWGAVVTPECLSKETEALLFAIYYSAVISINPTQCADIVGEPRPVVVERYKFATEQALARANLLNTHSTLLLQAAVLYLSVLRSDDGTRTVWSLIALISHVARSMGFHRDGTAFNLPPFETEMRRRIWHHIGLLDHRSTEYHGYEPTVADDDMTDFPPESGGPTDMILVQVRCHALRISREVKRASRSPFHVTVKLLDEHDKWVEKYVERCDTTQPLHYLAKEISYIAAERVRAVAYYSELRSRKRRGDADASELNHATRNTEISDHGSPGLEIDSATLRDQLFSNAITILKKTDALMEDSRLDCWAWHSRTYVQWHTLALAVLEVCIRPPCPQCDEAWTYAKAVYDRWLSTKYRDSTERGDEFVKPMGQLIARAQRVRDMQQAGRQHQQQQQQQQHKQHYQSKIQIPRRSASEWKMPTPRATCGTPNSQMSLDFDSMGAIPMNPGSHQPNLDSIAATTNPSSTSSNHPPVYAVSDFVPFLEMLPDELQNEWFESMARGNWGPRNDSAETMAMGPFFDFPLFRQPPYNQ